jgi:tetratricopeptide (TPR) repeat protein
LLAAAAVLISAHSAEAYEVRVDRRIERLAVIHFLATSSAPAPGAPAKTPEYLELVEARFGRFRGHDAVRDYSELGRSGLKLWNLLQIVWENDRSIDGIRHRLDERIDPASVSRFLEDSDKFAAVSGFDGFFEEHQRRLEAFAKPLAETPEIAEDRRELERYAGKTVPVQDIVVFSPLLPAGANFVSGNLLTWIIVPDGWSSEGGGSRSYAWAGWAPRFNWDSRRFERWHEWTHGLLDAYAGERLLATCGPAEPGAAQPCNGSWLQCLREHAAQVVAARLASAHVLPRRELAGLHWAAPMFDRLAEYEADRKTYPTLESFYLRFVSPMALTFQDGDPKTRERAQALGDKGSRAYAAGKFADAASEFSKAAALDPGNAALRLDHGVALAALGRMDKAGSELAESARLGTLACGDRRAAGEALSTLATVRAQQGRRGEAERELRKALLVSPPSWPRRAEARRRLAELEGSTRSVTAPEVRPDPRVELLALVHLLASTTAQSTAPAGLDYRSEAIRTFLPWRKHEAVSAYAELESHGAQLHDTVRLAWSPPEKDSDLRRWLDANVGAARVDRFLKALARFRLDSNFDAFYAKHADDLKAVAEKAGWSAVAEADRTIFEAFAGAELPVSDVIVPSLLLSDRRGVSFVSGRELVWVIGAADDAPVDPAWENRRWERWHEWSHALADPLVKAFPRGACGADGLPVAEPCMSIWGKCVAEHASRAVADRIAAAQGLPAAADPDQPWVGRLVDRLGEFESGRTSSPTLALFLPRLVEALPGFDPGPSGVEASSAAAAGSLGEAGIRDFQSGRREAAVAELRKAVALRPKGPALRLSLGAALISAGDLKAAEAELDEAVRLSSEACGDGTLAADALSTRASVRVKASRPADAAADLRLALSIAPKSWARLDGTRKQLEALEAKP